MTTVSVMMVRKLPNYFYTDSEGKRKDKPVTVEELADKLRVPAYAQLTLGFGLIDPYSVVQKAISTEAVLTKVASSEYGPTMQSLWQTNCYAVIFEGEAYDAEHDGFEHLYPVRSPDDPYGFEWDKVFVPKELGATKP